MKRVCNGELLLCKTQNICFKEPKYNYLIPQIVKLFIISSPKAISNINKEIDLLEDNNKLNDNIINFYLNLVCSKNSEFYYTFPSFLFNKLDLTI